MISFRGFRGRAALCQIGKVEFVVLAKNEKQLAAIYEHIMPEAPPFNPQACKRSILIEADILPPQKIKTNGSTENHPAGI